MKYYHNLVFVVVFLMAMVSACQEPEAIEISQEDYHVSVDKVTQIMIHDIFSPPVSSRVFAYPHIAAYEIIAKHDAAYASLVGQISDFSSITPNSIAEGGNLKLAALIAHIELSKTLIFSEDKMLVLRDSLYENWSAKNEKEFLLSKHYALEVVKNMGKWINADNYAQTRTMPKFSVNTKDISRWQPTPPAYMAGIEPHWNKIRPLVMDSAAQFKPAAHPPFSMDKNSAFFKELKEVYDISESMTAKGDESEEIKIAQFWDCNPYVSVVRGHMMFATKKITPGAHWMGICKIACRNSKASFEETVMAYTHTSIALFDGFISCWDEKYRSNLVRPETLINNFIDEEWKPILQTPPFPEYTSGHSVVSGAAAVVLTSIFGDNFAFDDDTEIPYGLPVRSFASFEAASAEAAISRMYGGIHYRSAVDLGLKQGQEIGKLVVDKIKLKTDK